MGAALAETKARVDGRGAVEREAEVARRVVPEAEALRGDMKAMMAGGGAWPWAASLGGCRRGGSSVGGGAVPSWEVGAETKGSMGSQGRGRRRAGTGVGGGVETGRSAGGGVRMEALELGHVGRGGERTERDCRLGAGPLERGVKEEDEDIIGVWAGLRVGWVFSKKLISSLGSTSVRYNGLIGVASKG